MSEDRAVYGKAGQKVNREDVVQAALTVARWCAGHYRTGECNCPFSKGIMCWFVAEDMPEFPVLWDIEEFLRNRGMKHEL